jgi:hypothetical protein
MVVLVFFFVVSHSLSSRLASSFSWYLRSFDFNFNISLLSISFCLVMASQAFVICSSPLTRIVSDLASKMLVDELSTASDIIIGISLYSLRI